MLLGTDVIVDVVENPISFEQNFYTGIFQVEKVLFPAAATTIPTTAILL
jgi:hypothetical protein